MINYWPECQCELCRICQTAEKMGNPIAPKYADLLAKESSVVVQPIISISNTEEAPSPSDEDKIDYTDYEWQGEGYNIDFLGGY